MSKFQDTHPGWMPSQLDVLKADQLAWEQWHKQNTQVRLTGRLPASWRRRERAENWMLLVTHLLAACVGALTVLWSRGP